MSLAEETATVSFVNGDYAYLKAESVSACSSCSARSACGVKAISKPSANYNLRVKNTLNLKEGDTVILAMESNRLLLGTVIMYILPLIMLFVFAYIGKTVAGELASIIGGVIGLFIGLFFIQKLIARDGFAKQFEPQVIRRSVVRASSSYID